MKLSVRTAIGFLLVVLCLQSCNLFKAKNPLCASWKLVSREDGSSHEDSALNKEFLYAYLRLYPDSGYSFVNPIHSAFGKWNFNTKDSVLTLAGFFRDSTSLVLNVNSVDGEWMHGKTTGTQPSPFLLKADPFFEYKDIDLLSRSSNSWRFKPDHKENREEIRERVTAHVEYMRQYFRIVHEEERPSFQTGFMHTPMNFYQNGIGVKTEDNLPMGWIKAFYDEDDARAGVRLLSASIQSMNGYPKDTKTFTEGYYKALNEMKDYLVKIK
jgi:hypothetical protein